VELIHDDSYYYIEITYSKEEAAVFRSMYIEKIVDIEEIIANSYLEPYELEKYRKESEQLKKELEVFNKWNPL
jgi:phosphopantetheinyl transferase